MQGRTTTARHGHTSERRRKKLKDEKYLGKLFSKNPRIKGFY